MFTLLVQIIPRLTKNSVAFYKNSVSILNMNLIHSKSKQLVKINDTVVSFRGKKYTVVAMTEPSHSRIAGRIVVKNERGNSEFFPSVFDCEWSNN